MSTLQSLTLSDFEPRLSEVTDERECRQFLSALEPRIRVELYVCGQDRDRQKLPLREIVGSVKRQFTLLSGGQTSVRGSGDYISRDTGCEFAEPAVIVITFLPARITNLHRHGLLEIILNHGLATNQEVVLAAVGGHGFWFPMRSTSTARSKVAVSLVNSGNAPSGAISEVRPAL